MPFTVKHQKQKLQYLKSISKVHITMMSHWLAGMNNVKLNEWNGQIIWGKFFNKINLAINLILHIFLVSSVKYSVFSPVWFYFTYLSAKLLFSHLLK